jgi:hypothetical protein
MEGDEIGARDSYEVARRFAEYHGDTATAEACRQAMLRRARDINAS